MTSVNTSPDKKAPSTSRPPPNGDHRKRPRNRTTQSCLNCHTSKRMCDRKRPACSRCTQLGLTGVCIYEVDDPKQRTATDDEGSTRLIKRVAELEGVVRELKNKPHPRWLQYPKPQEDRNETNKTTTSNASPSSRGSDLPSHSSEEDHHNRRMPELLHTDFTLFPHSLSGSTTPSSTLLTPSDEYTNPFSTVATSDKGPSVRDCDLASMPLGTIETAFGTFGLQGPDKQGFRTHGSHCGCLHDPTNYRTMLELSLGLRRAANVLRQSPSHQLGGFCPLHQGVLQLDSLAMDTLSSSVSSHRPTTATIQRLSYSNMRPWDMSALNLNPPSALDDLDSFMTWEPSRT